MNTTIMYKANSSKTKTEIKAEELISSFNCLKKIENIPIIEMWWLFHMVWSIPFIDILMSSKEEREKKIIDHINNKNILEKYISIISKVSEDKVPEEIVRSLNLIFSNLERSDISELLNLPEKDRPEHIRKKFEQTVSDSTTWTQEELYKNYL